MKKTKHKVMRAEGYLLLFFMLLAVMQTKSLAMKGGTGTVDDPYQIATAEDLRMVKGDLQSHYILVNDIDLENKLFDTIAPTYELRFTGSFDGKGHTIKNLYMESNTPHVSLFGHVMETTIQNIHLENVQILGTSQVAAIASSARNSTISNCRVDGKGLIKATFESGIAAGIVCTLTDTNINNCSIMIDLEGHMVGGLLSSFSSGTITNCFTNHSIHAGSNAGGLILSGGSEKSTISQCYTSGQINGTSVYALVGGNPSQLLTISDCFSTSKLTASSSSHFINMITNIKLSNVYFAGTISGDASAKYGIYRETNSNIISSYYDSQLASNTTNSAYGKLTPAMQTKSTYQGWDFENIWDIDEGKGYPFLRNLPKPGESSTNPTEPGPTDPDPIDPTDPNYVAVKGLTMTPSQAAIEVTQLRQLRPVITPLNASQKKIIYRSSDPDIAIVSENGVVTGVSEGYVSIVAITQDGIYTAFCNLVVKPKTTTHVSAIQVSPSALSMNKSETATLSAVILPNDASNKKVFWKSSNTNVADVSSNGVVTALASGTAIITATTEDGDLDAECRVTVTSDEILPEKVTVSPSAIELIKGEATELSYSVLPENAADKSVTFSSNDENVAKVDENGKITAIGAGTATVSIRSKNGITDTCTVTVIEKIVIPVNGVTITPGSVTLPTEHSLQLSAKIEPADADNQELVFRSSNPAVATVDENGKVTAVSEGFAAIVVITKDGIHTAFCNLTVVPYKGAGTVDDPFRIYTAEDLRNVDNNLSAHYILMNDIDLKNELFDVIAPNLANPFKGSFDGKGNTIHNIKIESNAIYVAFFGVTQRATIQNVTLNNIYVTGQENVASLVSYCKSSTILNNCNVIGDGLILGNVRASGFANTIEYSTISNCSVAVDVIGEKEASGFSYLVISSNITNCFANHKVIANAGAASSFILNAYVYQNADLSISKCYSAGEISTNISSRAAFITSIVDYGSTYSRKLFVQDCFSTSKINNSSTRYYGSFIYSAIPSNAEIKNIYFAGTYLGNPTWSYGIYGTESPYITSAYFDMDIANSTSTAYGKSTADMKKKSTYIGWDFDTIWDIDEGTGYPFLRNMPKPTDN